jgi:hypothetical protein
VILGLDISTKCIGYAVLDDENGSVLDKNGSVIGIGHIWLDNLPRDMWTKFAEAKEKLIDICKKHDIKHLFVEEPAIRFSSEQSSAHTITLLVGFNTLCSYVTMEETKVRPVYLNPTHARKVCGIKAKGKKRKEQTFEQVTKREPFCNWKWNLKRTGRVKDYHLDEIDAYVIAYCGFEEHVKVEH